MWQPIETAPEGQDIDLWLVDRKIGKGFRMADCHGRAGRWMKGSRWVTGKTFFDDEGERCFDPDARDEESTVATHWMPIPAPPV
jgi:hypothetical protein